jgi:hypothetical protein
MAALTGRQKPEKVENVLMGEWFADAAKTNFSDRTVSTIQAFFQNIISNNKYSFDGLGKKIINIKADKEITGNIDT